MSNVTNGWTTQAPLGEEEAISLHWADYVVVGLVLLLSVSIGIFFRCFDRKKKSVDDFLLAEKGVSFFPIAVSLFMSGTAGVSVLGDPVEVYRYGAVYWVTGVGYVLAMPIIAHLFAVLYHLMELNTAYQVCMYSACPLKYVSVARLS